MSAGDGDPSTEKLGEIVSIIPNGKWDQGTEQVFAYGMRAGIWRMLDWLKRHDRRTTFYMCGRAIERAPQIARAIVEAGHEPASHGWLWRPQSDYDSEAAERADFERCIAATLEATGERPRGSSAVAARAPGRARSCATSVSPTPATASTTTSPTGTAPTPPAPARAALRARQQRHEVLPSQCLRERRRPRRLCARRARGAGRRGEAGHPRLLNIGWHLRAGRPGRLPPSSVSSSFWTVTATRCG